MPQKIPLTTKLLDFARRVLFAYVLIHGYITQPAPTHLVPQTIWLFFQIGVGLGIFFVFFGKALEEYLLNEATFSSGLKNLTYALITNGAFVILIGQVGDPLAFVFQSYPGLATVFVVLALLGSFYAGFRISDFIGKAGGVWLIGKKHKRPTKPSAQDIVAVSSHESGHTLMYAVLNDLPDDMRAVVDLKASREQLGFVTTVANPNFTTTAAFAEWEMLTCLAGQAGELVLNQSPTLGADKDYKSWFAKAHVYLENQLGGIYYIDPDNTFRHTHNHRKINDLRKRHFELVLDYLSKNKEQLLELRHMLVSKGELHKEDLEKIFAKVHIPEGFPRPFGPKEEAEGV